MAHEALDKFGKFLVTEIRDEAISDWRMMLEGTMGGEIADQVRRQLASFDDQQLAVVKALVPRIVDTVLHHLLWSVADEETIDFRVQLGDGTTFEALSELSDGLAGELPGDHGWVARFSREQPNGTNP